MRNDQSRESVSLLIPVGTGSELLDIHASRGCRAVNQSVSGAAEEARHL